MDQGQPPSLDWRDGDTPVSSRFDDPYFSLTDGAAESRHVFLHGNGLPGRLRPGFHVAELGFGTGLNLVLTAMSAAVPVRYTGFEAYPMAAGDAARALARWPAVARHAGPMLAARARGATRFTLGTVEAEILVGDARRTLPGWDGRADAWYLDGFSPAKNPELWEPALLRAVAAHTAPGGSFATYTAAGHMRRALAAAGFSVQRLPGFGRKRHMSAGVLG
ncbi:tRNA (5-methylaminomethyl-2-thiouridine)(34)-methyltransferase MnmD [Rhodobacteraceae bacterium 2CG4]|uniref:tRNA (5-methylaminomethyl-2-thiouridine)(34)-methyltransferase MnmD n=1 Tax=Halovulum marinum TaxID=2662447 RepID=A0A6L5YW75_9RHOB|nr:tRNA (5-methylaminomethyl-2-thiouridine)(34)-methyltransferase MnmD [Halovulum marinum]MSU88606.1 tRNA (5-methylaminomethyl-2-thiouridine)(34)-methyltransferase MnmD [Halovulum marinum]